MDKPSLDDLAAFAVVADARSFTRAAAALGTSTSNLSHTIRRLEARIGARLLQRTSRNVGLTEAGATLLATLGPALDGIAGAVASLQSDRAHVAGTLRLTMTRQAFEAVVRPVMPAFAAAHPAASVEVLIDTAYRDLAADRLDAGIRLGEKLERDMIALKVGPDLRMAVVASPSHLAQAGAIDHPRDLLRQRCIGYRMLGTGALYAWEFERGGETLSVQVAGPFATNDPDLMLAAALDGLGVGYLLDDEVARHLAENRLVRVLEDWTPAFPGFHLFYPSRRQMRPVLAAFIEILKSKRQ